MTAHLSPIASALLLAFSVNAFAQQASDPPDKTIGTVTITGGRPTSLPTQIPTTIEGITGAQIERTINASDSEDALKYLPSLLVRKRYIGDYNHAVLSTRASGTGNSARSMVYADGILLSNYLGNGAGFTPRWGMVTPEEIERVDVLYGPFSAAYAGNSVGAVVDYITRMPSKFEAHAKLGYASQRFDLAGSGERDSGKQASASVGNRHGDFSWWINVNRLDSNGQPLVFATRAFSEGVTPAAGTSVVSGAIAGKNTKGQDWWLLGTTTSYHTMQDHAKVKLAYELTPTVRASYTLGWWSNDTDGSARTYLRDSAGKPVYTGNVVIGALQYNLNAASPVFAPNQNSLEHLMQGLSVKSNTRGVFDWEVAASAYDYRRDILRAPTVALPAAASGGAGRITDMDGTGWHNLNLRGTWRPFGIARGAGAQVIDFGYQQDAYRLRTLVSSTGDWLHGAAGARFSAFNGNTAMKSLFAQDTWTISPTWKTTLGLRYERWQADGGELGNVAAIVPFGATRNESYLSPKAALAYQLHPDWVLKASTGRAVRMPTVGELYQGSIDGNTVINTNSALKPEKSWTSELSAEHITYNGLLRATMFIERTRDALYSQALTSTVSTVQNVDAIHTRGLEVAWQAADLGIKGLELNSSATFTDSIIAANRGFAASVGKQQPRVPRWRATSVATYQQNDRLAYTLAARYSGVQYGQLDNSDVNGFSYLGFSKFFVVDARVRFKLDKQWSAALGIDNLNNYKYWAFHPYTQRTVVAELKFDL
ncbi:TonB-dependent receptor [Massilia sp. DWR3-1-1]|uniref:TonB-dependent receptor n=1 Tax=Massilia sp. DWR3-1-1 TaxID=2804559 RepID=UPI003CF98314